MKPKTRKALEYLGVTILCSAMFVIYSFVCYQARDRSTPVAGYKVAGDDDEAYVYTTNTHRSGKSQWDTRTIHHSEKGNTPGATALQRDTQWAEQHPAK